MEKVPPAPGSSNLSAFDPYASADTTAEPKEEEGNSSSNSSMLCCKPNQQNGCHDDDGAKENDDKEGMELLQQIFPDLSVDELKNLHKERLQRSSGAETVDASSGNNNGDAGGGTFQIQNIKANNLMIQTKNRHGTPQTRTPQETLIIPIQSPVGQRINKSINNLPMQQRPQQKCQQIVVSIEMDPTFLRIPTNAAVPLMNPVTGRPEWKRIDQLQDQILKQISLDPAPHSNLTRTLTRPKKAPFGLGFTIREQSGMIFVLNLAQPLASPIISHNKTEASQPSSLVMMGPAQRAGVLLGDRILGVNGKAFTSFSMQEQTQQELGEFGDFATQEQLQSRLVLQQAGKAIVNTPDPVVLHIRRYQSNNSNPLDLTTNWANPLLFPLPQTPLSAMTMPSNGAAAGPQQFGLFSPSLPPAPGSQAPNQQTPLSGLLGSNMKTKQRKAELDIVSEHMAPSILENDLLGEQELMSSSSPATTTAITPRSNGNTQPQTDFLSGPTPKKEHQPPKAQSHPQAAQQQVVPKKRANHPFATVLREKKLLTSYNEGEEERQITALLHRFTVRARQWETKSSFRLNGVGNVRDIYDARNLPAWAASEHYAPTGTAGQTNESSVVAAFPLLRPFTPSTPTMRVRPEYFQEQQSFMEAGDASIHGNSDHPSVRSGEDSPSNSKSSFPLVTADRESSILQFPALKANSHSRNGGGGHHRRIDKRQQTINSDDDESYIPLTGCRKALCIRIVNYFVDGDKVAYTIWVYDAESECEWYAPVRYLRDFKELHQSTTKIAPSIGRCYPFPGVSNNPIPGWARLKRGDANESESQKEHKCQQLEGFLRFLSGWIYTTSDLNERAAEVAVHLQSFLGCDSHLAEDSDLDYHGVVSKGSAAKQGSGGSNSNQNSEKEDIKHATRIMLRRAIQRYTCRLFLLPALQKIVNHFVSETRAQHASSATMMSSAGGRKQAISSIGVMDSEQIKDNVLKSLDHFKKFLDELQSTILEGCRGDLIGICSHRDYAVLNLCVELEKDDTVRDAIINEGLREQLEIGE
jgi:hypothetical protein